MDRICKDHGRLRCSDCFLIEEYEKEIEALKVELQKEREALELAHAHIHNLQDAYNECRNWFSNVEFIPETEDLDEYISLDDCDEQDAVNLKSETEDFAMGWFRYYYALIKERYQLKSLNEYTEWSDKNLDKLAELNRETVAKRKVEV